MLKSLAERCIVQRNKVYFTEFFIEVKRFWCGAQIKIKSSIGYNVFRYATRINQTILIDKLVQGNPVRRPMLD
jgi:hypothetical protein